MKISPVNQKINKENFKIPNTKIRFVVKEKVRIQVINTLTDKIIREIPFDKNTKNDHNSLEKLYF